jgi:hypothetical protein
MAAVEGDRKYRVTRQRYFGAKAELAANGLTKKQADEYVAAQQESNDGYSYTVEAA